MTDRELMEQAADTIAAMWDRHAGGKLNIDAASSSFIHRAQLTLAALRTALAQPAPKCDYPECTKQCGASTGYCHKSRHAPAVPAVPEELSPEFTDTARAALLWVLWHHQGASSAVGQPIRFALGMGAHDRLNEHQIAEAKRWATTTGSTTAEFHKVPAATAVPLTDEHLYDLLRRIDPMTVRLPPGYRAFARAIEQAHGITGDSNG